MKRILEALQTLCSAYTALGLQTAERQKTVGELVVACQHFAVSVPFLGHTVHKHLYHLIRHCRHRTRPLSAVCDDTFCCSDVSLRSNDFRPPCTQNKTPTFQLSDVKLLEGRAGSIPGASAFDRLLRGGCTPDIW